MERPMSVITLWDRIINTVRQNTKITDTVHTITIKTIYADRVVLALIKHIDVWRPWQEVFRDHGKPLTKLINDYQETGSK